MRVHEPSVVRFDHWDVEIGERLSQSHDVFAATVISGRAPNTPLVIKRTAVDQEDRKRGAREDVAYFKLASLTGEERSRSRIVRCFARTKTDTSYSFLIERLGESVTSHARRDLSDDERRDFVETILCDVYTALATLRDRGFAHRDAHPGNMLLPFGTEPGAVASKVTLIDFSHAYHQDDEDIPTSGSLPGSRVVQPPDILVRDAPHRGFVDDIYALGMAAHIALAPTLPTAWVRGGRRVHYRDGPADFAAFKPRNKNDRFEPLPSDYTLVPDAPRIRQILGDGPAAHALMCMLDSDSTRRESLLGVIEGRIEELQAARERRHEELPTGGLDGHPLDGFVDGDWSPTDADESAPGATGGWAEDTTVPPSRPEADPDPRLVGADAPRIHEVTTAPVWAPWMATPDYYAPQARQRRPVRARIRRPRPSLPASFVTGLSKTLVFVIPLLVFTLGLWAPVVGLFNLPNMQMINPVAALIIAALGAAVALFLSSVARPAKGLFVGIGLALIVSVLASTVFIGLPTSSANAASALMYSFLPGIPWRVSEWPAWVVVLFVLLWVGVLTLIVGVIARLTGGLKGRPARWTIGLAVVAIAVPLILPFFISFPLGEASARAASVDCGTSAIPFLRGGTDRVCVPALDGWRGMTEEELAADTFAIAAGEPEQSAGPGSLIALTSMAAPCLTAFVQEKDVAESGVADSYAVTPASGQPDAILSRLDADGKVERARYGWNDYTVYRSTDASVRVSGYLAFSATPFHDLAADPPSWFGSTDAFVQLVEQDCGSETTSESLEAATAELLSALKVSDTGYLSRSYMSVDPAALETSGLSVASLRIPVGGPIGESYSTDTETARAAQQALGAGRVALGRADDAATATVMFFATEPAAMANATQSRNGWKVVPAPPSDATLDETYYMTFDRAGTMFYASVRVYALPGTAFGDEASNARDRVLDGVVIDAAKPLRQKGSWD